MDLGTGNLDRGGWYRWNGGSRWEVGDKNEVVGTDRGGVVDMDQFRLVHMDRDRGNNWGGKYGIYLEKGHYYKGRKRFGNGGYYTLYQLWLQ